MIRRALAVAATVVLALSLAGCPEDAGTPQKAPTAGAHQQPPQPPAGAQQPAPVADPGEHNKQPGELDLHVEWVSENNRLPACEWSLNAPGRGHPCENMQKAQQVDRYYYGLWEYETTAKAGDVGFLSAQASIGGETIRCSYFWKGRLHALPDNGKRCGGTFTLD